MLESRPVSRARMSSNERNIQSSEMSSNTTQSSPVQGRFVSYPILVVLALMLILIIPTSAFAWTKATPTPQSSFTIQTSGFGVNTEVYVIDYTGLPGVAVVVPRYFNVSGVDRQVTEVHVSQWNTFIPGSVLFPEGTLRIGSDDLLDVQIPVILPYSLTYIDSWGLGEMNGDITVHDNVTAVHPDWHMDASGYVYITQDLLTSPIAGENNPPQVSFLGHSIFTINFETNGGSTIAPISVPWNTTFAEPAVPTNANPNVTFAGWYQDVACTIPYTFTAGQSPLITVPIADYPTDDSVLYAKWNPTYVDVTLNPNGGALSVATTSPISAPFGVPFAAPADPTRLGHSFTGWFTAATGGTAWNFTTMSTTIPMTLYARWSINSNTVYFNSSGGSAVGSQSVNYGSPIVRPGNPSLQNYTFDNWLMDISDPLSIYAFGSPVIGSFTLYATWTRNQYVVSFDTDGGSVVASQTVYAGPVLKPASPMKDGLQFAYWKKPNGTKWNFSTDTVNSNITLTAHWVPIGTYPVEDLTDYDNHDLALMPNIVNQLEAMYGLGCFESICHDSNLIDEHPTLPDIGQAKTCDQTNCHTGGTFDYPDQASCYDCHTSTHTASNSSAAHVVTDTGSLPPTQYGVCSDCHKDTCATTGCHNANNLIDSHPQVIPENVCRTCHASQSQWPATTKIDYITVRDAVISGNTACATCHTGMAHVDMHTDVEDIHVVQDGEIDCTACHDLGATLMTAHSGDGILTDAQTCSICHDSKTQRVKNAIAGGDTTCAACHDAHEDVDQSHTILEENEWCTDCHISNGGSTLMDSHMKGVLDTSKTCVKCHSKTTSERVKTAVLEGNIACEACHTSHASVSHDGSGYYSKRKDLDCASCHVSSGSLTELHPEGGKATTGCSTCHASDNLVVKKAIREQNDNCDACHNADAGDNLKPIHPADDPRLVAPHVSSDTASISKCASCHTSYNYASGVNLMEVHSTTKLAGKSRTANTTVQCSYCHGVNAGSAVKTAVTAGNTNCDACHHGNSPYLDIDFDDVLNSTPGSLESTNSAHGGYQTTSNKCNTCHSVHRAPSSEADSPNMAIFVEDSCANCHTVWGGGAASKLIEWEESDAPQSPHAKEGCRTCHSGSPHGAKHSEFNAMNRFMLGSGSDVALKRDLASPSGNVSDNITYKTGAAATASDGKGADWFQNGKTAAPAGGFTPDDVNAAQYAAAKATATGYTCSRAGCHDSTQFAINKWGWTPPGQGTGHATGQFVSKIAPTCGPCHPGNSAGGYRTEDPLKKRSAAAYGCDQCHDLVGRATNSTAWPHASAGIDVYEWNDAGTRVETGAGNVVSGNNWMYANSIAQISELTTNPAEPRVDTSGLSAKPAFTLSNFAKVGGTSGGEPLKESSRDAVCLKCHVPTDVQSKIAAGVAEDDVATKKLVPAIGTEKYKGLHVNPIVGLTAPDLRSKSIFQYR